MKTTLPAFLSPLNNDKCLQPVSELPKREESLKLLPLTPWCVQAQFWKSAPCDVINRHCNLQDAGGRAKHLGDLQGFDMINIHVLCKSKYDTKTVITCEHLLTDWFYSLLSKKKLQKIDSIKSEKKKTNYSLTFRDSLKTCTCLIIGSQF